MNLQGYPEKSRFFQQGEAQALFAILDVRGFAIPNELRARVLACTDVRRRETWVKRAVTALGVDAVFEEDAGPGRV